MLGGSAPGSVRYGLQWAVSLSGFLVSCVGCGPGRKIRLDVPAVKQPGSGHSALLHAPFQIPLNPVSRAPFQIPAPRNGLRGAATAKLPRALAGLSHSATAARLVNRVRGSHGPVWLLKRAKVACEMGAKSATARTMRHPPGTRRIWPRARPRKLRRMPPGPAPAPGLHRAAQSGRAHGAVCAPLCRETGPWRKTPARREAGPQARRWAAHSLAPRLPRPIVREATSTAAIGRTFRLWRFRLYDAGTAVR